MSPRHLAVVLLPLFVAAAPGTNGAVVEAAADFAVWPDAPPLPLRPPAFRATSAAAEQDPATVETSLGLDRPLRRLIQQGLTNEGFDPGAPDGLFGPRTRAAIRGWQESRGVQVSGYLNGAEAELLRAAGSPQRVELQSTASPPDVDLPAAPALSSASVVSATDTNESPIVPEASTAAAPAPVPIVAEATAEREEQPLPAENLRPTSPSARTAQLPPEILADRYLLRAERLLAADNSEAAHDVMLEIMALQDEHEIPLPDGFRFRYAQLALRGGRTETAISSLNEYLINAGREGEYYREALELLDSAEEALRLAEVERRRADIARRRADAERRRVEARQRQNDELAQRQMAAAAQALPRDRLRSGGLAPEMVRIASGRFFYWTYQGGPHLQEVEIAEPYAISRYEITLGEFEHFVDNSRHRPATDNGDNCRDGTYYDRRRSTWRQPLFLQFVRSGVPSRLVRQSDTHPVVCVSIGDAMAYAEWLSQETGYSYRLPSAAEWQYAARAGSADAMRIDHSERSKFCGRANLHEGSENSCTDGVRYTTAVGNFQANSVGLYDMIGNVAEWVLACARVTPDKYLRLSPDGSYENPSGCDRPVAMGGAWYHAGTNETITFSGTWADHNVDLYPGGEYHIGFRVVRDLPNDGL